MSVVWGGGKMSVSPVNADIGEKAQLGILVVLGLVLAFVAYELYTFLAGKGPLGSTVGAASNLSTDVLQAGDSVARGAGNALNTVLGTDTAPTDGTPKSSSLFYSGIGNFLTTGSIYGDQGSN